MVHWQDLVWPSPRMPVTYQDSLFKARFSLQTFTFDLQLEGKHIQLVQDNCKWCLNNSLVVEPPERKDLSPVGVVKKFNIEATSALKVPHDAWWTKENQGSLCANLGSKTWLFIRNCSLDFLARSPRSLCELWLFGWNISAGKNAPSYVYSDIPWTK